MQFSTWHQICIAIISETHFKQKHSDNIIAGPYTIFCRDRVGRRGGGVAIYVRSALQSSLWTSSSDVGAYELIWVRVETAVIGALYHPPRPQYIAEAFINYMEACIEEIVQFFPQALIILAGDFNQLSTNILCERTGLTPLVHQPTRGANILLSLIHI